MNISPGKYWGMRRLADSDGFWRMVATDQREMLAEPIAAIRGTEVADYDDVARLVSTLAVELQGEASALLMEPIYGYLPTLERFDSGKGLMLSYESLYIVEKPGGLMMEPIPGWSVEKIRSLGADAVKVLVLYRADAHPEVRRHQERYVQTVGDACRQWDVPFLLEVLVYPLEGESNDEFVAGRAEQVVAAVKPFTDPKYKVDIFKLETPGPLKGLAAPDSPEGEVQRASFHRLTDELPRPWVLLSAGMNKQDFRYALEYAYECKASGYLAGRALWSQAPLLFPDFDAITASLREESLPYMRELNELTRRAATPWQQHPSVGGEIDFGYPVDREFAASYQPGQGDGSR